jgi:Flp pilus assembly protein TadG
VKRIARSRDPRPAILERPDALRSRTRRDGSRGQVLVIFAGAAFVLLALMALVIDVSWYWANTLKVQRAADAAALAGAVWLPGDATTAAATARTEAKKNGYTDGSGGITVTPTQDTTDPRQLDVQVSAPVGTFFMRMIGINSINATRVAKGLYVLPVPMGSPLAYYGVGDYYVNTGNPPVASVTPFASTPTSGKWTTPSYAWKSGTGPSNQTTSSTDNQAQAWSTFNINTAGITGTITGVVVSFTASVASGSSCQVAAAISWNSGSTYGNLSPTTANLTTLDTAYSLGSSGGPAAWDSGHAWAASDFANGSFLVQLTYHKNSCGMLSLNQLVVTVSSSAIQKVTVKDPNNTVLPSLGAWGAIITQGGNRQNGDAYAPANNGGSPFSGSNTLYNGNATNGGGYLYAINLPSAGGSVNVFDPGFCAMGGNPSGAGNLGAGDHWIGTAGTAVSTYYTLWNTGGLLGLDASNWGAPVYTSGSLFEAQNGYDPQNGSNPGSATSGCDAYHNAWWTLPTGSLPAGTYALQVTTTKPTDASKNAGTNAENMFAIEAIGSGSPTIYGNGKMAVYNNLQPGNAYQLFYLARIDKNAGAGKTALIDIFDPGDVPGNAVLKVLSPDGGVQTQATFSYTTDGNCNATVNANSWSPSDACSASGVSQITTSIGGHSSFNNTWIHIRIAIPSTYGSTGLWGPGVGGWWQIRYETPGGGNDTTTWQVSISGNPVHLQVP